ncbi:hypothetical protein ACI5KX_06275 [Erythrobacter sp. GH1-10]|uniref:hypothetical protein n=1 Tax=Erythrobacter sp. GH1-10 TaxID=3349334 RepID=UPI00387818FE
MLRTTTIFAATVLLAACGSETSGEFTTGDGETGEYTIDETTGETTASITTDESTATLRSGANVEVDLPSGFSLYPGAEVVSNTVVDHAGGKGVMLVMQSSDSTEDLIEFYREQAEEAGIKVELDMRMNEMMMLGGQADDGTTFSFNTSPSDDGGNRAQLIVGTKQ